MLSDIFWFSAGLIVGWNLIPQPVFVKNIYDKVVEKVKGYIS